MSAVEPTRRNERESGKAPDAFRTISEVAEELDIPQHVLRFWETRFGQIKPLKRGGGRRYYRPDDVDLLRGIRHLLYGEGYTIRGVQRLLKERGVKFVQGVWLPGGTAELKASDEPGAELAIEDPTEDPTYPDEVAASGETEDLETGPEPAITPDSEPQPQLSRVRSLATPLALDKTKTEPPLARPLSPALGSGAVVTPAVANPSNPAEERGGSSLSPEARTALQNVLADLTDCRRLVDAALKGD